MGFLVRPSINAVKLNRRSVVKPSRTPALDEVNANFFHVFESLLPTPALLACFWSVCWPRTYILTNGSCFLEDDFV